MSDDFELGGEDEIDPTSSIITYYVKSGKTGEHLCVYKAYTFILFF